MANLVKHRILIQKILPRMMIFALITLLTACTQTVPPPATRVPTQADSTGETQIPAASSTSSQVAREETLVLGGLEAAGQATGIQNPFSRSLNTSGGLYKLQIESLFYQNFETGEIEPWLAESFEMNDRSTELTIRLRQGIEWSDGQPFTPQDVIFTLNMLKANAPALDYSEEIHRYVSEVTAPDDQTIQIVLNEPNPRFISLFTSSNYNSLPIVPEHIWKDQDPAAFKNFDLAKGWPVFTGPYRLVQADETQQVYDRREDWWAAKTGLHSLPAPRRVILVDPGPEDQARASLEANQVDAVPQMSLGAFEAAKTRNPKVLAWTQDAPYGWSQPCPDRLAINNAAPPWDNPGMRRALNLAIDKQGYADAVTQGAGTIARWIFPSYAPLERRLDQNQDLLDQYEVSQYNPEKALQLFEINGYAQDAGGLLVGPDGHPLTVRLLMPSSSAGDQRWELAAATLTGYLTAAGIGVEPHFLDAGLFEAAGRRGEYDLRLMWTCGSTVDPLDTMDNYLSRWVVPVGQESLDNESNTERWINEEYTNLVDRIAGFQPDDAHVDPLFRQALELWLKDMPAIPLNQNPWIVPFNTTYWTQWPTLENNTYQPPLAWQTVFQIILNLQPAH